MQKIKFLICLIPLSGFCQTKIFGYTTDLKSKVVPFVNITIKKDFLTISNTLSNEKGYYSLIFTDGGQYIITFSSLGYKFESIDINVSKTKIELSKNIFLKEEVLILNTVVIQSKKSISIKKDTIIFDAKKFLQGNEQTVEDLLKKIPGINIDANGTIKIGNQEVEKVMIDGDDMFEKGYKILTKNMPVNPIDKVELYQNYSKNADEDN